MPTPPPPTETVYSARTPDGRLIIAVLDPHQPHSRLHQALRAAALTPEPAPADRPEPRP